MKNKKKGLSEKFVVTLRNLRSGDVFKALKTYCHGQVLDIGGSDFYLAVRKNPHISFTKWTNLEPDKIRLLDIDDDRYETVIGDGCNMKFANATFDTVVNMQVLEHVMDPLQMVAECGRVLKVGGVGIFLIPQTSVLHFVPHHYYNFTKYWIREAMKRAGLEIVELKPLGGRWTTTASHFLHFFFQSFSMPGYATGEEKRNVWFYLLFPIMAVYAIVGIPICMFFSLGDLTEEPNNYLVVVKKI